MSDETPAANATVADLLSLVASFNRARGWDIQHDPLHLAASVSIEAAELLECFQWCSVAEAESRMRESAEFRSRVSAEIADVLIYLLSLCAQAKIDPAAAVREKLTINERRFPVPPLATGG